MRPFMHNSKSLRHGFQFVVHGVPQKALVFCPIDEFKHIDKTLVEKILCYDPRPEQKRPQVSVVKWAVVAGKNHLFRRSVLLEECRDFRYNLVRGRV